MTETNSTDQPALVDTCCVCGGGPVTYRNYRDQPFCWPCADCQCAENPCVRTGINDPAVSAEAAARPVGPAEHCGNQLPRIGSDEFTECVLRPGHNGSHADHQGARWTRRQGAGPTADEYAASQLRAVRIQTLLDDTRDRVRKLHKRFADGICFADGESYPCPTIAALEPRNGPS